MKLENITQGLVGATSTVALLIGAQNQAVTKKHSDKFDETTLRHFATCVNANIAMR